MKPILSYMPLLSLLLAMIALPLKADTTDTPEWQALKVTHFGDRPIRENATDLMELEAPFRAEDAAIVPISVRAKQPQTADAYIQNIHIIIDRNPMPYSANFHLSPTLGTVDIATRVRIDRYTHIRAIAEMNDGSLHMVAEYVRASGGCSAPAMKDAEAAIARLGQMQMRMRQPTIGQPMQAQVIISHPNYSGLQFDQQRRTYIPPHFVKTIDITFNGEALIKFEAGISVSEDPSLRFVFTPETSGVLKATAEDSKQAIFTTKQHI